MVRYLSFILSAVLAFVLGAGGYSCAASSFSLERLENRVNSSEITFAYTYSAVKGKVTMTGQGDVVLQGDSFILKVDRLEIYCDGTTIWTLDRGAKELVIEDFDGQSADIAANPALLLCSLASSFDVTSQSDVEFAGEKAVKVGLSPKSYPQFKGVSLYFRDSSDSDILIGASIELSDGTVTEFTISGFRYNAKREPSSFVFDLSSLDSSWVVTDMR